MVAESGKDNVVGASRKAARAGDAEIAGAALLLGRRVLSALAYASSEEADRTVAHATATAWWKVSAQ